MLINVEASIYDDVPFTDQLCNCADTDKTIQLTEQPKVHYGFHFLIYDMNKLHS
jgi:hypothetical protein